MSTTLSQIHPHGDIGTPLAVHQHAAAVPGATLGCPQCSGVRQGAAGLIACQGGFLGLLNLSARLRFILSHRFTPSPPQTGLSGMLVACNATFLCYLLIQVRGRSQAWRHCAPAVRLPSSCLGIKCLNVVLKSMCLHLDTCCTVARHSELALTPTLSSH